jgi:protein involved in polysaccharide export with SLBB domain
MTKNLSLLFLMSCTLGSGQTASVAAAGAAQPSPSLPGDSVTMQQSLAAVAGGQRNEIATVAARSQDGTVAMRSKSSSVSDSKPDSDEEDNSATHADRKVVRAPLFRSDFELFCEDATGQALSVYGRRLFEEVPSTFAPLDRIPVPADYAIGPDDELLIRVWGKVDLDSRVTVDRNGQISLPKVGALNVAGLRYAQLESYLRSAVGTIYKDFELNVTLGHLRSIQILVVGNARQPGSYTLSSLSTLVDALFASGGPSATGTMRHIQMRRGNRVISEFDLYDLQQKGDKSHDVQLLPGDEIYIPPIGPQVAVVGNVNEPGIFELKDQTTIGSLLEQAGGLTNLAATGRVLLERVANRKMRRVEELALDAPGLQRAMRDGDLLRISPISPEFENAVTIRGNVASPGRFPWHEGMRVSDLIPSRAALLTRAHWTQQNHLSDDPHTEMLTDIARIDAEINWNYAAIERLDERDLSTRLIAFNLGKAIENPASAENQLLKVGDVVTVFSRRDLPLPLEKVATFVSVGGEVNTPGVYRVNPGETLRALVERAGGLTSHSYLYASQLARASTRQSQAEQLKLSFARMRRDLFSNSVTGSSGPAGASADQAAPGRSDARDRLDMQQTLIDQLAEAQPTGRVVLGMKPDAGTVADIPELSLEDGDSFYIPPRLGVVQVVGEVYNANAFRYQAGKRLCAYLNDSGGPTRVADVSRIFLIRADGSVLSRQEQSQHWLAKFENTVLMPGDAIVVPPKLKPPGGLMGELLSISQVLSQSAMTGAVFNLIH